METQNRIEQNTGLLTIYMSYIQRGEQDTSLFSTQHNFLPARLVLDLASSTAFDEIALNLLLLSRPV